MTRLSKKWVLWSRFLVKRGFLFDERDQASRIMDDLILYISLIEYIVS